jgi:hypothetical protein
MLIVIDTAIISTLLILGVVLRRQRTSPPLTSGHNRMRFPNLERWLFYTMALASAIASLAIDRDAHVTIFVFGTVIPTSLGTAFVLCSRYFIEIGKQEVLIGKVFGTRSIQIADIRRIFESSSPRAGRSLFAYNDRGSRLFVISGNVEDYPYVIGQLKARLEDGTVIEEPGWFSRTRSVVHRNQRSS